MNSYADFRKAGVLRVNDVCTLCGKLRVLKESCDDSCLIQHQSYYPDFVSNHTNVTEGDIMKDFKQSATLRRIASLTTSLLPNTYRWLRLRSTGIRHRHNQCLEKATTLGFITRESQTRSAWLDAQKRYMKDVISDTSSCIPMKKVLPGYDSNSFFVWSQKYLDCKIGGGLSRKEACESMDDLSKKLSCPCNNYLNFLILQGFGLNFLVKTRYPVFPVTCRNLIVS